MRDTVYELGCSGTLLVHLPMNPEPMEEKMTGSREARLPGVIRLVDGDNWYVDTGYVAAKLPTTLYAINLEEVRGVQLVSGKRVSFIGRERNGGWWATKLIEPNNTPVPSAAELYARR